MNLERLRRETAADHDAVEGSVPLMKPGLTRAEYTMALQSIYGVVAAWEDAASAQAPAPLRELLLARQRQALLRADLTFLCAAEPTERAPMPTWPDTASLLGAMYVMEGSTLGGQFIARHVAETLDLAEGEGNAYFRGHGSQTGAMWKEFCEALKTAVPDEETDAVVSGAKEMFRVFGAWMRRTPTE